MADTIGRFIVTLFGTGRIHGPITIEVFARTEPEAVVQAVNTPQGRGFCKKEPFSSIDIAAMRQGDPELHLPPSTSTPCLSSSQIALISYITGLFQRNLLTAGELEMQVYKLLERRRC